MTDWREQEYEDNYWAEKQAVSTWDAATSALFLQAVEQAGATRAEEREEVRDDLERIVAYDGYGTPLRSWQVIP